MEKIKIITDSGCDLDLGILEKLNVTMLPFEIHFGDEVFYDRVTLSPHAFYEKLNHYTGVPKTSLVTPGMFAKAFQEALEEAEHVIYIGFASALSGTFQAAILAKNLINAQAIDVFDSKSASAVQALMIFKAVEMARAGSTATEILQVLKDMADTTELFLIVGNLDMLHRGGRLSGGAALLGSVLNIKPILQIKEGYIIPFEKVRGIKAAINEFVALIKERADLNDQPFLMAYSGNDRSLCDHIKETLIEKLGIQEEQFFMACLGGAIGCHVGSGTVGIAFRIKTNAAR